MPTTLATQWNDLAAIMALRESFTGSLSQLTSLDHEISQWENFEAQSRPDTLTPDQSGLLHGKSPSLLWQNPR